MFSSDTIVYKLKGRSPNGGGYERLTWRKDDKFEAIWTQQVRSTEIDEVLTNNALLSNLVIFKFTICGLGTKAPPERINWNRLNDITLTENHTHQSNSRLFSRVIAKFGCRAILRSGE